MVKRLQTFQASFGAFLFFIPLIMMLLTGEVRPSISDYAYSNYSNTLVTLLTVAGLIYVIDAWLNDKYYNIMVGAGLIGVALTPHLDFPFWHYFFASVFFLGNNIAMVVFSSSKQRIYKIAVATVILICFILSATGVITVFIAEWIGMLPASIHFIGEAYKIID